MSCSEHGPRWWSSPGPAMTAGSPVTSRIPVVFDAISSNKLAAGRR